MATNSKLIESFRTKIKGIFKESVELEDPLDQRPDTNGKPTMPPKPTSTPPVLEADEVQAAPPVEGTPLIEEEKVTLTVSLLKSLLDWAHGEEEAEGEAEEGEEGAEVAPEVAPIAEEEVAPTAPVEDPAAGLEGEGMEDAGVEAIEIQALVDKVKELAQTKGELTDEDFGEIVAAAEAAEGEGEAGGDSLDGIMGDEGATPEAPITENIGEVIPKGAKFKNEGNKGIGK